MQTVALTDEFFEGVISVEHGDGWLKPWRLPHDRRRLFPSPDDGLLLRAEMASGARLRFETDSEQLRLRFLPLPAVQDVCAREVFYIDVALDGELLVSAPAAPGSEEATFDGLPPGPKVVDMWLLPDAPIAIRSLEIDDDATCRVVPDPRPRWITYGSSLTHCVRSNSPARSWPAIVARKHQLNLTCLGFGGQCHLDPMVARVIRDRPADLITLKLGINCISGSLSARTFPAAVMGLVSIIRERHTEIPIGLISPIGYPPHETTPNVVGYTIEGMRRDIEDVYERLVEAGDENLTYVNGLEVFNLDLIAQYTQDQCHPNGDGIEIMAENFDKAVMSRLPIPECASC